MNLEFYNCPDPEQLNSSILPQGVEFLEYVPNFELIEEVKQKYQEYENILVIAHGGSITTFYGLYSSLNFQANKKAYFLNTTDPDYIYQLKKILGPADTLVVAISKSGETVTQIEALMQFADFPLLIITGKSSSLRAIGEKLKADIYMHPTIGGRFTGITEVTLLPAGIIGLDVKGIYEGAQKFYLQFRQQNMAWEAASIMWQLEQSGIVDVFMPFYTHNLFPLSNLIVQLCHESFGKEGKGQTYFAHEAPESQHHTNQRFFGGKKNIAGIFTTIKKFSHQLQSSFPPAVNSVQIRGKHMVAIDKIPLDKTMEFEAQGTMDDAKINGIPLLHLEVSEFSAQELGSLIAFWQLFAVYSSVLRRVNPFDQPQVENSKTISLNKRLAFKGLL